jgi:hypothetical protein
LQVQFTGFAALLEPQYCWKAAAGKSLTTEVILNTLNIVLAKVGTRLDLDEGESL